MPEWYVTSLSVALLMLELSILPSIESGSWIQHKALNIDQNQYFKRLSDRHPALILSRQTGRRT